MVKTKRGNDAMNIRAAIVDDEPEFLARTESIVTDFFRQHKIMAKIDTFRGHRLLMYELADGTVYDIYFLDIMTKDDSMDGLEAARQIREYSAEAYIIFITGHVTFAPDAFEVNAYRYITKDTIDRKLPEVLESLTRDYERARRKFYLLETANRCVKLYYNDIYYIRKEGKYSVILTSTGDHRIRLSLAALYAKLDPEEFIYVERGFIVNIARIDRLEEEHIFLENGSALKISRAQIRFVRDRIASYWGERL